MEDAIVVGAGFAGLAAARSLAKHDLKVLVLEARDRVGGRVENGTFADGQWIEVGGQWIGPGHDRMYELVAEFGLETFALFNDGKMIIDLMGKQSTMSSKKGSIPKINPFALADLGQGMMRFSKIANSVNLAKPWLTPNAKWLDGQTFNTWISKNLKTKAGREYFAIFAEAVFAADPIDFSLLHAAFHTRSNTDMETLMAVDGGAQQDRVMGGTVLVAEKMAESLGDRVVLNSTVRSIDHTDKSVRITTRDGRVFEARTAIITIPPTLAGRFEYSPALPSWRDQLTQRIPAGSVIKMFLTYESPFWRDAGFNAQIGSDRGPIKVTFDNTPPGYPKGIVMGFMEGSDGREWSKRTTDERKAVFIETLVRYFGEQAANPIDFLEKDWMAEEFSRGCYGAHFAPGVWTQYGAALNEPIGRLYWAGTECSAEFNGYIEGAVRSGERTASEVRQLLLA